MGVGSALLAVVSTARAQAGFYRFSPGASGLLSSSARCCLLPFWALPPLCAPAQGGGHGATGLRGQVRCDTSLLCCCGLYLHSDASQIRLASSLRASWLGFRSPLQAVFSFSRACSGHFNQASLHRSHVRLMVCYQASTEMRAGSDSQRASTGSVFSCRVFQAFPGFGLLRKDTSGGRCGGLSPGSSHPAGSVVSI